MISEFNTNKSCLAALQGFQFKDNTGADVDYEIAINGATFEPNPDEIYLQEFLLPNDNDQGLSNSASQVQFPIYQITINIPKIMGKWKGIEIYAQIQSAFSRGANITLDPSQRVLVEQINRISRPASDTHNRLIASIDLSIVG